MDTSRPLCRALLVSSLLITMPLSQGQAHPAQRGTTPRPVPRLGALPHTLSLPAEEVSIQYPDEWSLAHPTANTWVVLNVPADQLDRVGPTVRVHIGYLERSDHAGAVRELAEIANEYATQSRFLTIGGWPALERVQLLDRPQPSEAPPYPDPRMVQITTAVAAGSLLIRLEGIYCEPAGAAALAGLRRAVSARFVQPDATVVCLVTGHGFKDPESIAQAAAPFPAELIEEDALEGRLLDVLAR